MSKFTRCLALATITVLFVMLAGCNTVEGVGRDIESAGDSIEDAAN